MLKMQIALILWLPLQLLGIVILPANLAQLLSCFICFCSAICSHKTLITYQCLRVMLEGCNQAICQGTICFIYGRKAVLIHILSLLEQGLIKCGDDGVLSPFSWLNFTLLWLIKCTWTYMLNFHALVSMHIPLREDISLFVSSSLSVPEKGPDSLGNSSHLFHSGVDCHSDSSLVLCW